MFSPISLKVKFKYGTSGWTWHGHSICITKPVMVSETYYVDVCDGGEDKYRFGFNGQEKVNEISGIGNHNTAEFWEYDTRLGRRWNLDPKPTYSFSNYSTFAGNPIVYSDYLGDTAVVKWRSGFLGLGKKNESKYVGGQWIDSKTRDPIDISKVDKKSIRGLMNDYQKLNEIEPFSPVMDIVNNIPNNVFIRWGTDAKMTTELNYFTKLKAGLNPDIFVSVSYQSGDPKIYENNKNHHTPSYVIMGHELGHVWDLRNSNDYKNFIKDETTGASDSEINAMFWENVLRLDGNLPLRLMYDYDVENKVPILPNLIKYEQIPGEGTQITIKNKSGFQVYKVIRKEDK